MSKQHASKRLRELRADTRRKLAALSDAIASRRFNSLAVRHAQTISELYRDRPAVEYVEKHLGRKLTPKQAEILTKLEQPPYRVLARSANTQGKTFVGAAKCCQFYDTRDPSVTLITAPVYEQVRDLAFRELRSMRPDGIGFLPKATRLESSPSHYVHGLTANKPDSFQGRHDESIGLWFDEATGIHRDFWGRADTMFVGSNPGSWWLATYNPNDASSPAYAAEESNTWHVVTLNALDHPNIAAELLGEAPPIPAAIRLDTVIRRLAADCKRIEDGTHDDIIDFEFPFGSGLRWRANTPEFEAQILGRWPLTPATALWSPSMFDLACRPQDLDFAWTLAIGCDVARFGDDASTIASRIGRALLDIEEYRGVNTTFIANRLREACAKLALIACQGDSAAAYALAKRIPCYIDDTGGYGAGVIDQSDGYAFIGVNMSMQASDPRFVRVRSQLWCQFADLGSQPNGLDFSRLSDVQQKALKRDLTSARYSLDYANRRVVEPKVHIKERLGCSPDRADAVVLCYSMIGE